MIDRSVKKVFEGEKVFLGEDILFICFVMVNFLAGVFLQR